MDPRIVSKIQQSSCSAKEPLSQVNRLRRQYDERRNMLISLACVRICESDVDLDSTWDNNVSLGEYHTIAGFGDHGGFLQLRDADVDAVTLAWRYALGSL